MSQPTTGIFLNGAVPAAPAGDQNVTFQSDNNAIDQSVTAYPQKATASLRGVVKPDGTTITVAGDGTISTVAATVTGVVTIVIEGGGSVPSTGLKGHARLPTNGTITGWDAIADQAGSFSLDLCFHAGSAPPSAPSIPNTTTDKISASAPVTMSAAQSASGSTSAISTWSRSLTQWGTILPNLTAVTTCTRITVQIYYTKS